MSSSPDAGTSDDCAEIGAAALATTCSSGPALTGPAATTSNAMDESCAGDRYRRLFEFGIIWVDLHMDERIRCTPTHSILVRALRARSRRQLRLDNVRSFNLSINQLLSAPRWHDRSAPVFLSLRMLLNTCRANFSLSSATEQHAAS
jgi:hypothetical protein